MRMSFELSEADLDHFKSVMTKARDAAKGKDDREIIDAASHVLSQVNQSETSDFIRDRMNTLETLIGMAVDQSWGLMEEYRQRVIAALTYFTEADDLIPYHNQ